MVIVIIFIFYNLGKHSIKLKMVQKHRNM